MGDVARCQKHIRLEIAGRRAANVGRREEPPPLDEKVITKVGESTFSDTNPYQNSPRAMTERQIRIGPEQGPETSAGVIFRRAGVTQLPRLSDTEATETTHLPSGGGDE